ncbi:STAS-like domain-containing protein [Chroococcidiopsis sp.]|uniref:STAS-like domain-containing protein n=1 Tax=Chroococcidiopsis sp. TaxID=3088168 RepID=UPI003F378D4E
MEVTFTLPFSQGEDQIWDNVIKPALVPSVTSEAMQILYYGCTEILNNANDHSNGTEVSISIVVDESEVRLMIEDDGIGLFQKLQSETKDSDPVSVALNLVKGGLTTDPARHSGEGLFFSSRIFNTFLVESRYVFGQISGKWLLVPTKRTRGTKVTMRLDRNCTLPLEDFFAQYAPSTDDFMFTQTSIPVVLAQTSNALISRSQAKRLTYRLERFKKVVLDFTGVDRVGRAFVDELFRVWALEHPSTELSVLGANSEISLLIQTAQRA